MRGREGKESETRRESLRGREREIVRRRGKWRGRGGEK